MVVDWGQGVGFRARGLDWQLAGGPRRAPPGIAVIARDEAAPRCGGCSLWPFPHDHQAPSERHSSGTVLMGQGASGREVLHLLSGLVLATATNRVGDEMHCTIRGPGATLGLELLVGEPSRCELVALTTIHVCRVPAQQILADVDVCSPCFQLVRMSLDEAQFWQDHQGLLSGSAPERVARLLLQLDKHSDNEPVDLRRGLLARAARIRPETLSRTLSTLRSDGLIGPERVLRILDRPALKEFASVP